MFERNGEARQFGTCIEGAPFAPAAARTGPTRALTHRMRGGECFRVRTSSRVGAHYEKNRGEGVNVSFPLKTVLSRRAKNLKPRPSVSFVSPSRSHLLPHFARGLPSPPQRAGKKRMPAALLASMFWPAPTLALCQVQRARLTPRPSRPRPKLHPRSSRGRYLCSARGFCTALCLRQPPSAFLVPFSAPARPCAAVSARFFSRHVLLVSNAPRARPTRPARSVL